MKPIIGLGNPGRRYVNNRHNVGFKCLDFLAREQGISLNRRVARNKTGTGEIAGIKAILAKPQTFMNRSGEAVAALMRRYSLSTRDILIIYDDLDLPLGKIRIRESGSSGGHKGVKSIISHLGSQNFARIRIGIAPLGSENEALSSKINAIEYVLSDFTAEEKAVISEVYPKVADAIRCLLAESIAAAMNKYN